MLLAPGLITAASKIVSVCTAAGTCFALTKQYIKDNPKVVLDVAGVLADKKFQYGLLQEELESARGILASFDQTIKRLSNVEKEYDVSICTLAAARKESKKVHAVIDSNFGSKLLLAKDPEYYRPLLQTNIVYLTSMMTMLNAQAAEVLNAIEIASNLSTSAKRDAKFEEIRVRYSTCS